MKRPAPDPVPSDGLDKIETDWSLVHEPSHIVLRYADAVQRYFRALLRDPNDADEVAQEFFLHLTQVGLPYARQERGRFRDYLKKAVRNAALTFLRCKRPAARGGANFSQLPDPADTRLIPDQEWIVQWRRCLLQRAWRELKKHQQKSPDSLYHTVLRLVVAHPKEDSKALAARATKAVGRLIRPDAFRKQLSRARRKFAELLLAEVQQTLDRPEPDQLEEELVDLGLMVYVRDFLPPNGHASEPGASPK